GIGRVPGAGAGRAGPDARRDAAVGAEELHGVRRVGTNLEGAASGTDGRGQLQLVVERDDRDAEADVARPVTAGEGIRDVELDDALAVELRVHVGAGLAVGRRARVADQARVPDVVVIEIGRASGRERGE